MAKSLVALVTKRKREHKEKRQQAWNAMYEACSESLFACGGGAHDADRFRAVELCRSAIALASAFEAADAKRQRARQP